MTTQLETCRVAPPPGTVAEQSLPLTFFDMSFLHNHPVLHLLFYEFPCSKPLFLQSILPKLKQSLSLTLKHFFPLSCSLLYPSSPDKLPEFRYRSGDSVSFTVSESSAAFDDLVGNHPHAAHEFYGFFPQLPPILEESDGKSFQVLAVQVNLLEGRGFCIGVAIHHSVGDGRALLGFISGWASITKFGGDEDFLIKRDESRPVLVKYPPELDTIFWSKVQKIPLQSRHPSIPRDRIRATYVFSQSDISKLKHLIQAKVPSLVDLSSFVALAAYVWSGVARSVRGEEEDDDDDDLTFFVIAVDLRERLDPAVPGNYFGNCLSLARPSVRRRELVRDEGVFVAAAAMAAEIKNRAKEKTINLESAERLWGDIPRKSYFMVSGSSRFDLYSADFGWGKVRKQETLTIDEKKYTMSLCGRI